MMKMKEYKKNYSTTLTVSLERLGNMISEKEERDRDIFRKRPILGNRILTPIRESEEEKALAKQADIERRKQSVLLKHGTPVTVFENECDKNPTVCFYYLDAVIVITPDNTVVANNQTEGKKLNAYELMLMKKAKKEGV